MMAGNSSSDVSRRGRDSESTEPSAEPKNVPSSLPEEDLGVLPEGYDEDRLAVIPRDPQWLFLVWDLAHGTRGKLEESTSDGRCVLRLHVQDGAGADSIADFPVPAGENRFYVRLPCTGVSVTAELGIIGDGGSLDVLVRSRETGLIVDRVRPGEAVFTTLPFHSPLPGQGSDVRDGRGGVPGRLMTEDEFRRLFGAGPPGSNQQRQD